MRLSPRNRLLQQVNFTHSTFVEPLLVTRNERTLTATYPRTVRVKDPLGERSVYFYFCLCLIFSYIKNNTTRGPQTLSTVFLQLSCFTKILQRPPRLRARGKSLGDRERMYKSGTRWCAGYARATVHPVTGGNVPANEYGYFGYRSDITESLGFVQDT